MRSSGDLLRVSGLSFVLILPACVGSNYSVVTSPGDESAPPPKPVSEPAVKEQPAKSDVNVAGLKSPVSNVKPVKLLIVGNGTTLLIPPLGKSSPASTRQGSSGDGANPQRFVFEVLISPNEPGVSFDPGAVALHTASGEELDSSGLLDKDASGKVMAKAYSPFCKVTSPSQREDSGAIPLMEGNDYCFRIRFDQGNPAPGTTFTVDINGIGIQGRRIKVPTVEYEPATGQFIES